MLFINISRNAADILLDVMSWPLPTQGVRLPSMMTNVMTNHLPVQIKMKILKMKLQPPSPLKAPMLEDEFMKRCLPAPHLVNSTTKHPTFFQCVDGRPCLKCRMQPLYETPPSTCEDQPYLMTTKNNALEKLYKSIVYVII